MIPERSADDERALNETAAALRAEAESLRSSAQTRAVVEQAKGVLVERHRMTLDEAMAHLRAISRQHGLPLIEVAADVVGAPVPVRSEWKPGTGGRSLLPQAESWPPAQPPRSPVMGTTAEGDEIAQLVLDMLHGQDVAILTLYGVEVDRSLRLVGQVGLPDQLVASWWHVPPGTDVPYTRSVVTGRAQFFESRQAWVAQFPALASAASVGEAVVTMPLSEGKVTHVVGLIWNGTQEFDAQRREALLDTVRRTAVPLLRLIGVDPHPNWLDEMLSVHLDPWIVLEPVMAEDRYPRDFVVVDVATPLRPLGWQTRRLLELWPSLAVSQHFVALCTLVQTGGVWSSVGTGSTPWPWGAEGTTIRAVRLGEYLAIAWRSGATSAATDGQVPLA